jgi:PAS domain S-box-containing protein
VGKAPLAEALESRAEVRERVAGKEELREREERLRLAEEAAASGIWEIDLATDTVRGTRQFFLIMGLEPTDEPVPMSRLRALRVLDDRQAVNRGYADAVERGVDFYESEYRIVHGDGQVRWIFGRGRVVRDDTGAPVRYSGVDIDITERKNAELALAESETRLRLAVGAANIGIWDWNVLTNEMSWSEEAKALYGFPPGEPVTFEQVREATHPQDLPRTSKMSQQALNPDIRLKEPYDYRIMRPDGEVRWILAQGEATFAVVGGVERGVRYTGTIQDITERKRAENRIRKSESRLRLAIEAARLAVWEYDIGSDTVQSTPEFNRLLGFPEDRPVGIKEIRRRYYPGDQERVKAAGEAALARGDRYFQVEFRFRRPDDIIRWLLLRAEIVLDEDSRPHGAIGALLDITDRKEAEEHRQFLISELQHRTKNLLSLVRAIAAQTFRGENQSEAVRTFASRLVALGNAHDLLHREHSRWAELAEIVEAALSPHGLDRFEIDGAELQLSPRQSLAMSLALNELATNAVKYGALANAKGRVAIGWRRQAGSDGTDQLVFTWRESGGPAVVRPSHAGFGTRLIQENLANDFAGTSSLDYCSDGLLCTLIAPWPKSRARS